MAGVAWVDMTWDMKGLYEVSERSALAATLIGEELEKAMWNSLYSVEARAKDVVPTDTHTLQRSINSQLQKLPGEMRGTVGTPLPYARAIEFNWKSQSGKWPPPGVFGEWMRRHGIPESAEFRIRAAIARRGYKDGARPYLTRALGELIPEINERLARVPGAVIKRLGGVQ